MGEMDKSYKTAKEYFLYSKSEHPGSTVFSMDLIRDQEMSYDHKV